VYSVGDVATLAGLSVRMLRHYDEIGLLRPHRVDPHTGYRSYHPSQLARLHRILALKGLGFTLAQVHRIVDANVSPEELRGMLRLRQEELVEEIEANQQRLQRAEHHIALIDLETNMAPVAISMKRVEPLRVAELSAPFEAFGPEIGPILHRLYPAIFSLLAEHSITPTGPAIARYEEGVDGTHMVFASVPVAPGTGTDDCPGASIVTLPAFAQAVSTIHHGPMATIDATYSALLQWVEANSLRTFGYSREIYLDCPPDEQQWVTELQFPVGPA
jgi:DNA-binding transcriptional MerR regulator/effector-binding domain-containing protein